MEIEERLRYYKSFAKSYFIYLTFEIAIAYEKSSQGSERKSRQRQEHHKEGGKARETIILARYLQKNSRGITATSHLQSQHSIFHLINLRDSHRWRKFITRKRRKSRQRQEQHKEGGKARETIILARYLQKNSRGITAFFTKLHSQELLQKLQAMADERKRRVSGAKALAVERKRRVSGAKALWYWSGLLDISYIYPPRIHEAHITIGSAYENLLS